MTKVRSVIKTIIGESKREKQFFFVSFLFVLIICALMIRGIWLQALAETSEEALTLASVAEAGLENASIESLSASADDVFKREFIETKRSLEKIVSAHQEVQFAYIFMQKGDKIYFAADSATVGSKDYSPPGMEYTEVDEGTLRAFREGETVVAASTDRWGTWVSVMVPMKDSSGKVIAVMGIDYAPEHWYKKPVSITTQATLIAVCIVLLYLSLMAVLHINISLKEEKRKLSEANERILEEEELFRTVFEQSPVGISINSSSSLDHNAMYEKIVGRGAEEIIAIGWESFTHPEDLQTELPLYEKFKNEEISGYNLEKRYIKPDGSIVWCNVTVAALKMNRESDDYLCIVEDITERVRAEKDLRERERSYLVLLSNLPGMAYRCRYDEEWTMLFVSEGCLELTGYHSASLLHNRDISFNELIVPKYRQFLWEKWISIVKNRTKLSEEYEIITASGEIKWVLEQGQAVYDENGNVEALEGLIIDITDRKKKEEEILYLNNHDHLTGIYNRRFLESEMNRLDREEFLPLSVMIGDINGVKLVNDAFGHAQGDILIKETARIILNCCRKEDVVARTGGDEFVILMPNTDRVTANGILEKIKRKCEEYNRDVSNEAYSINISLGHATKEKAEESFEEITKLAEDFMYKRKLLEHKSSHSVILSSIKATMYERSHETQEHAERLTYLSRELGKRLRLTQQGLDELELVATLHDIGKVGIDDRILNKPDKLTDEEWIEMKKHSEIGYRIAMSSPDLVPIAEYILSHHERWDGQGYPQGIRGEEIPLISRIVSIVDAFDAMTEDRSYRQAMTPAEAADEIRRNAGTQFDPRLVKLFLEKVLPNYRRDGTPEAKGEKGFQMNQIAFILESNENKEQ